MILVAVAEGKASDSTRMAARRERHRSHALPPAGYVTEGRG
jgi:hypothetical protein